LGRLDGPIAPVDDVSVVDVVGDLGISASPGGLLERGGFLEALEASWADAVDGRGRLVLVTGEAGIGKTALASEFCERQRPQRLLWGACDGLRTPRPLAPLADIAANASDPFAETVVRGKRPARCFAVLIDELGARPAAAMCLASASAVCVASPADRAGARGRIPPASPRASSRC